MLRQPVSSLFRTGSLGSCRSSSRQAPRQRFTALLDQLLVLPTLISIPSAVASIARRPAADAQSTVM